MLTHFLRRVTKANRPRMTPSPFAKLKLEQSEARDVPALFAVQLMGSMPGEAAATITDNLAANPSLPTDENGATLVEAASLQEAIGLAIVGSVVVEYGGNTYTYSMAPGNVGASAGEHRPFVGGSTVLQLEDMAYSAAGSDWDYNDHSWSISAAEVGGGTSPPPTPPTIYIAPYASATEGGSNGWFALFRSNSVGELTVTYTVPAVAGGARRARTTRGWPKDR